MLYDRYQPQTEFFIKATANLNKARARATEEGFNGSAMQWRELYELGFFDEVNEGRRQKEPFAERPVSLQDSWWKPRSAQVDDVEHHVEDQAEFVQP